MNDLSALGIIMAFSIILGVAVTSVFAMLGLVKLPKNPKEFVLALIEYTLFR